MQLLPCFHMQKAKADEVAAEWHEPSHTCAPPLFGRDNVLWNFGRAQNRSCKKLSERRKLANFSDLMASGLPRSQRIHSRPQTLEWRHSRQVRKTSASTGDRVQDRI